MGQKNIKQARRHFSNTFTQEELFVKSKTIYARLSRLEMECNAQQQRVSASPYDSLSSEQWQALIALHRTLLHEHYDFFLTAYHPSAGAALAKISERYSMPARMWRHGIQAFLDVLQAKLPSSEQHMLTFMELSYEVLAVAYATIPAHEDTWIECLGDLGRYR